MDDAFMDPIDMDSQSESDESISTPSNGNEADDGSDMIDTVQSLGATQTVVMLEHYQQPNFTIFDTDIKISGEAEHVDMEVELQDSDPSVATSMKSPAGNPQFYQDPSPDHVSSQIIEVVADDVSDISLPSDDEANDTSMIGPDGQSRPPRDTKISKAQQKRDNETLQPFELYLARKADEHKVVMTPLERWVAARYIRDDCNGAAEEKDVQNIYYLTQAHIAKFKKFINNYWRHYKVLKVQWPTITENRIKLERSRPRSAAAQKPMFKGHVMRRNQLDHVEHWLADEDFYRCLDFPRKLAEIKEYMTTINHAAQVAKPCQKRQIEHIREMTTIHDIWHDAEFVEMPMNVHDQLRMPWGTGGRIKTPPKTSSNTTRLKYMEQALSRYSDSPLIFPVNKGPFKEARLTRPCSFKERNQEDDPYGYTLGIIPIRRNQEALVDTFQVMEQALHEDDTDYVTAPMNYLGPYLKVPKILIERGMAAQHAKLLALAEKLRVVEMLAPRPALREVLVQIQRGMIGGAQDTQDTIYKPLVTRTLDTTLQLEHAAHERAPIPFNHQDAALLLVMTEPSWNSQADALRFPNKQVGQDYTFKYFHTRLVLFAQRVEELFTETDEWPDVDASKTLYEVLDLVNDMDNEQFSIDEAPVFMKAMVDAKRARTLMTESDIMDGSPLSVQKPLLTGFPESRYIPLNYPGDSTMPVRYNATGTEGPLVRIVDDAFARTAFKLGRAIRDLTFAIAANPNPRGEQAINADRLEHFVQKGVSSHAIPGFLDLIPMRSNSDSEEDRLASLQNAVILECNRNWSTRHPEPNFAHDWAFCGAKPEGKEFFRLDKWPLTWQSRERQEEIVYSTPWTVNMMPTDATRIVQGATLSHDQHNNLDHHVHSQKRKATDDLDLGKAQKARRRPGGDNEQKERWFHGDTRYPFGETVIQQAWQSMTIDDDLQDVPEFAHIYKPGLFKKARITAPAKSDPHALPELPTNWNPINPLPPQTESWWKMPFGRTNQQALRQHAQASGLGASHKAVKTSSPRRKAARKER